MRRFLLGWPLGVPRSERATKALPEGGLFVREITARNSPFHRPFIVQFPHASIEVTRRYSGCPLRGPRLHVSAAIEKAQIILQPPDQEGGITLNRQSDIWQFGGASGPLAFSQPGGLLRLPQVHDWRVVRCLMIYGTASRVTSSPTSAPREPASVDPVISHHLSG